MFYPSLEEVKTLAKAYNKIPVSLEMYMDFQTPMGVLSRIKEEYDRYFLLESIEGGEKWARYTFIGFNPNASFYVKNGKTCYATREKVKKLTGNPLDELKKLMETYRSPKGLKLPPFTGGGVGYFGYDTVKYVENLNFTNKDELDTDDIKLMFFDEVICFDHYKQKIILIVNIDGERQDIEASYEEAKDRLKELVQFVKRPSKKVEVNFDDEIEFTSNMSKEEFISKVEKAKEYIANGDIFQVVPSQVFRAKIESNLFDVYRMLRTINPSPYMYLMQFEDLQLAGASPETLVKVQDKVVVTQPIAGTRPRGKNDEEDQRLCEELLKDPKELAEHNMLVDLARNDIGRISEFNTVEVTDYMALKKLSHVTHITTNVKGQLKEGLNAIDVVKSILPAGTLSGAPKVRAMEIIEELENNKRGIYGGAIGYIGYEGNLDTCIGIRTVVKKDGMAYIQAGCGIVLDSNPEAEYQETINKASALFEAMKKVREII
ncbi:anthranilate synthase component I [Cellulosilyticum ruminicola]|uniref:anthranilate synthase component I n=1 Tax=Cellulosilyticum ruminicola TaxID=425254 RepID=UPI0006D066FA|nr:anthranilate synthase component I [Cellulosilyticum ruminicola]